MIDKKLYEIYNELVTSYANLKAEVICAELLENSKVGFDDLEIVNKGTFSRSFRRDVIDYIYNTYSTSQEKIQLNLARNGLYDILPQGVFHELVKSDSKMSYKEIRQKHKQEERDARTFFSPLENEFFLQKVKVEQNERNLVNTFLNHENGFLLNFWGLDSSISEEYRLMLALLLPFAHKILGKPDLVAFCLEKIINDKVTIIETTTSLKNSNSCCKSGTLGLDFVLVLEESNVFYPSYEIQIGPVSREYEEIYLESGAKRKFIDVFCDFFVPIEIEATIKVIFSEAENDFVLDENKGSRMGLSTKI